MTRKFSKTKYRTTCIYQIHVNRNGKRYFEWDLKKFIYNDKERSN